VQVLDRQNVGYIGPTEIREILKNLEPSLSPVEVEEIVREVDLERNGKIDINGEK
jgi:Ca2+-binding EF-hand superfamily protein